MCKTYFEEAPKTNRADFYNFRKQLNQLIRFLQDGARLITIKGLRRTGKTSLLLTALNEVGFPYVVIDTRVFAQVPVIPQAEFMRVLEAGLNDFLTREKTGIERIVESFKAIRGVEAEFPPPRVRLSLAPPERRADLLDIVKSLGRVAEKRRKRFVLVLDEAQELRKVAGYDLTLPMAHIYDYIKNVQMIVTGSQVGVLNDFLKVDDPKSALFGRVRMEIEMPHLSEGEAIDFLKRGGKQIGMKMRPELLEEAVEKLDGIIGWLTHVGVYAKRYGRFDKRVLDRSFNEGARLAASELENFLAIRLAARRRYVAILRWIEKAGKARWADIKEGLQISEKGRVADRVFNGLLEALVKANFVRKNEDGTYSVADPLLSHALQSGFVK